MTRCEACGAGDGFLFDCGECGGRYCVDHQEPGDHACAGTDAAGDGPVGSRLRPVASVRERWDRLLRLAPVALWLLGVRAVDGLGVEPGLAGTAVIALLGSVANWRAALAIPRVDAWLHAGRDGRYRD